MKILKEFGYTSLPISFSEGNHTYRLDGVYLAGVSSLIGRKDKDWKVAWALKESAKFLKSVWLPNKIYTTTEIDELIKNSKSAYLKKSGKAIDGGKIGHALIEESIITGTRINPQDIYKMSIDDNIKYEVFNIYSNWLLWESHHNVEYLAVELILGDKELWVAGTADCIAIVDGELNLIDWKSSQRFSEDICIQTAVYVYMLKKGGVTGNIIRRGVRLDKGIDQEGKPIKNYKPSYLPENDLIIPTDYDQDLECFFGLKKVDKWIKYIEKNFMVMDESKKFKKLIF